MKGIYLSRICFSTFQETSRDTLQPFHTSLLKPAPFPSGPPPKAVPLIKYAGGCSMVWSVLNLPSPAACQALSMISSRLRGLMEKVTSPRSAALLPVSSQRPSSSVGDLRDTCCRVAEAFSVCLASHIPAA